MVALELILSALCHMLKVVATSSTARVREGSRGMSLLAAVICFYSSLRSEWCIETPLRRQILQTLPLLSTCLSWPFVHTAHSPSCAPPIQHMAWPRASIDLTGSGCQATMVGTSECLGDILLCVI